jgi:zinc transport system substrate-binding protein
MGMKLILICVLCVAAVAVGACGPRNSATGRERVVAGFYPLAYAARAIGRSKVEVTDLTPPGAEPHDLEVSPRQVEQIRAADLVLLLGHGFQPQLENAASAKTTLRLLDTPGLDRFRNGDPHVWLDPVRFALIVERIGAALHRKPESARLGARLRTLDREYRRGLADCARREVVTSHEAFAYLAQRYRLRQIAITGLSPEAEPAPRDLQHVVGLVRETGATTVFFETLVSRRVADSVARETGARTAVLNPIEGLTPAQVGQGKDYFSLMRTNLANLRHALGCR